MAVRCAGNDSPRRTALPALPPALAPPTPRAAAAPPDVSPRAARALAIGGLRPQVDELWPLLMKPMVPLALMNRGACCAQTLPLSASVPGYVLPSA